MRVNFVYACVGDDDWRSRFARAVMEHCGDVELNAIDLSSFPERGRYGEAVTAVLEAPPCDLWYFAVHTDWTLPFVLNRRYEPVGAHAHGGYETGALAEFSYSYPDGSKTTDVLRRLSFVTVNSSYYKRQLESKHCIDNVEVIGFPITLQEPCTRPKNCILVPGRFSNEKQVMPLLAKALGPFSDSTVFCSPSEPCEVSDALLKMGFEVRVECRSHEYRELLSTAKVVVTASYCDTLNLSLIDGMMYGATPVAPRIEPYTDYVMNDMYEPFSIESIRHTVAKALHCDGADVSGLSKYEAVNVIEQLVTLWSRYE